MLLRILFILIAAGFTFACKPQQLLTTQGYIIGSSNDIQPLTKESSAAIPEHVRNAAVLIATQVDKGQMKFCSGSLVAPAAGESLMRILTNHHCFANVDEKGKIDANWIPVACLETKVYFGFSIESTKDDLTSINCKENTLRSDVDGDVAIFTLAKNPPEKYQPLKIQAETERLRKPAYILHYPDVASNYRIIPDTKIRLPAASITNTNCESKGLFSENEWHLDKSLPYSFKHTCDLVQGSSGSALINAETNEIMGVNWGGIKINYKTNTQIHNVATGAEFVSAFLAGDAEELKKKAREQQNSSDAEAATAEVDRSDKKEKSLAGKVREAACGQIGLGMTKTWETLLVLLLLTGPVLLRKLFVTQDESQ